MIEGDSGADYSVSSPEFYTPISRSALFYLVRHGAVNGPYKDNPGITENGKFALRKFVHDSDLVERLMEFQSVGTEIHLYVTRTTRSIESMRVIEDEINQVVALDNIEKVHINPYVPFESLSQEDTIERISFFEEDQSIKLLYYYLQYTKEQAHNMKARSYEEVALAFSGLPLMVYNASKSFISNQLSSSQAVPRFNQITIGVGHSAVLASEVKFFTYYPDYAFKPEDFKEGSFLKHEMDYRNRRIIVTNPRFEFAIDVGLMDKLYRDYFPEYDQYLKDQRAKHKKLIHERLANLKPWITH